MMQERMYGVVLWADARDSKAVIWCEDHGNLAYYSDPQPGPASLPSFDAGDLIQFDLTEETACRRARNPERVVAGHAPHLSRSLGASRGNAAPTGDNVIPFPA